MAFNKTTIGKEIMLQWFIATTSHQAKVTLPITFNKILNILALGYGGEDTGVCHKNTVYNVTNSSFYNTVYNATGEKKNSRSFYFFVIGY